MRALIDTHTFLWAGSKPAKLSPTVRQIIADGNNELLVSAVTAWEITTKVRIGRLPEAIAVEKDLESILIRAGYTQVALSIADALRAGRLTGKHRDPWDRMLAAQALGLGIPILSTDRQLDGFGVLRIW